MSGEGKLFGCGEAATVIRAVDRHVRVGQRGKVTAVEWDAGGDGEHLYVVRFEGGDEEEFLADELAGDEQQLDLFDKRRPIELAPVALQERTR